ncbi:ribose-5-phosphate isomerase RpiA [Clostridium sp. D2Q-11]|uniref:Ribose-5-phosphate isomerase A n=1 Tax=Anaeromonas frigoriresistens TaxID=2683708 RepID=A0A942Z9F6_9FIRM|nr:ribose-5-phosphate isomerase RpiA [Anaeromonas frigoriresistens]MBS4539273.1 ribose-5-phosphate isomerase RpiA [Anaeromonas frigoriresistens]
MDDKKIAGERAAELIRDGMIVGLGTGSTVYYTMKRISQMLENGLKIKAVSTSSSTTTIAQKLGIPLVDLNDVGKIDITIDGADEVDSSLNGIKGGGGALLYEKLVAISSEKVIWVVDSSKIVNQLGEFPLPVEVIPFAYNHILTKFKDMNLNPRLRINNGDFFITDSQHYIIDLYINKIEYPYELEKTLNSIPGVVEHGLFINIVDTVIIGKDNSLEIVNR